MRSLFTCFTENSLSICIGGSDSDINIRRQQVSCIAFYRQSIIIVITVKVIFCFYQYSLLFAKNGGKQKEMALEILQNFEEPWTAQNNRVALDFNDIWTVAITKNRVIFYGLNAKHHHPIQYSFSNWFFVN